MRRAVWIIERKTWFAGTAGDRWWRSWSLCSRVGGARVTLRWEGWSWKLTRETYRQVEASQTFAFVSGLKTRALIHSIKVCDRDNLSWRWLFTLDSRNVNVTVKWIITSEFDKCQTWRKFSARYLHEIKKIRVCACACVYTRNDDITRSMNGITVEF